MTLEERVQLRAGQAAATAPPFAGAVNLGRRRRRVDIWQAAPFSLSPAFPLTPSIGRDHFSAAPRTFTLPFLRPSCGIGHFRCHRAPEAPEVI